MKKMKRKLSILLMGIFVVSTLAGCSKFDASGYVKAVLDNIYFNDSAGIVEMKIGTAEEAADVYEKSIESLVNITLSKGNSSEELKEEFRQFYKDLCASAKYTVGEAVEVDETTFEVPVTCERLKVFEEAVIAYEAQLQALALAWKDAALAGNEVPSDDEKYAQFFTIYRDCLRAELSEAAYDAPITLNVRVESVGGVWTINQEDKVKLECAVIDFEKMFENE